MTDEQREAADRVMAMMEELAQATVDRREAAAAAEARVQQRRAAFVVVESREAER